MPRVSRNKLHILYAIQGTGNGHVVRALELIPLFKKYAKVTVLVSGIQADIELPFKVKFRLKGLSFIFGKHGGIDFLRMFKEVSFFNFMKEVNNLDLSPYDVIINDFEPVSSMASKKQNIPCIQLSHQSAVIQKRAPKPKMQSWFGMWILHNYVTRTHAFGFHFEQYSAQMSTPVIRTEVRKLKGMKSHNHFTVYLPAYSDKHLLALFLQFPMYRWVVFSKKAHSSYIHKNVQVHPVHGARFVKSMASSRGVLCGAGFETPAECLYLGKKLLVVPMHHQYEQYCNAIALEEMGVSVLHKLGKQSPLEILEWIERGKVVEKNYKDNTHEVVNKILNMALELAC